MVNELTDADRKRMLELRDELIAQGVTTEPCDRPKAEEALRQAYRDADLSGDIEIFWADSPVEATRLACDKSGLAPTDIYFGYGNQDTWLSGYVFFAEKLDVVRQKMSGLLDLIKYGHWWVPFDDFAIMVERPTIIERDEDGRMHSLEGPAFQYKDDFKGYYVHGVQVPEHVVLNPETITEEEIDKCTNQELRRVMIDQYGYDRYMNSAEVLAEDEFGALIRRRLEGDEDIVMVRVLNSTPEPDGSIKTYLLRVPPHIKTPHEGVAWTFGFEADKAGIYQPQQET